MPFSSAQPTQSRNPDADRPHRDDQPTPCPYQHALQLAERIGRFAPERPCLIAATDDDLHLVELLGSALHLATMRLSTAGELAHHLSAGGPPNRRQAPTAPDDAKTGGCHKPIAGRPVFVVAALLTQPDAVVTACQLARRHDPAAVVVATTYVAFDELTRVAQAADDIIWLRCAWTAERRDQLIAELKPDQDAEAEALETLEDLLGPNARRLARPARFDDRQHFGDHDGDRSARDVMLRAPDTAGHHDRIDPARVPPLD